MGDEQLIAQVIVVQIIHIVQRTVRELFACRRVNHGLAAERINPGIVQRVDVNGQPLCMLRKR